MLSLILRKKFMQSIGVLSERSYLFISFLMSEVSGITTVILTVEFLILILSISVFISRLPCKNGADGLIKGFNLILGRRAQRSRPHGSRH